jgi:hypothetical protein
MKLEKREWHPYFDRVSKTLDGKRAEIEIDALNVGAQVEAEWLPLLGITYDQKDDIVEIIVEGLDHLVHKPKEVFVTQDGTLLSSMEVIDDSDYRHIVRLRDPLMLPSP